MKYFSADLTGILACGPLTSKVKSLFTNCSGGLLSLGSYYITQDKQWTYHVTLMRVRVTIVAVKKIISILNIFLSTTNKMQHYTIFFIVVSALVLHVLSLCL